MYCFHDVPALWRRFVWFAMVPCGLLAALAVVRLWFGADLLGFVHAAAILALSAAWFWWCRRYLRAKARAILVRTRGLTCLGCGYCLVGMDEGGQCPECGRSYYADHLCECWSRAAGFS